MWLLLKYDFQKGKKFFCVISIIFLICCGMLLLLSVGDHAATRASFVSPIILLVMMGIIFFGFIIRVASMFPSRFMKDSIVMLAPISKQEKALEPLVVVIITACIAVSMHLVVYLLGGNEVLKGLKIIYPYISVNPLIFMFVQLFLLYFSICLFFTSALMLVWSVMKKRELKNPSNYTYAYFIALGCSILFTDIMDSIGYPVNEYPLFIISISAVMYAISYYLFVYR